MLLKIVFSFIVNQLYSMSKLDKRKVVVVVFIMQSVSGKYEGQFDALKISDVPFPMSGAVAAIIRAPFHTQISEFSVCYRIMIDFYNDGMVEIMKAEGYRNASIGHEGVFWQRTGLNTGMELYGYQFFWLFFYRNIPGGGLGNRAYPYWHAYNLAKNLETSKWFSFCTSYSSKLKRIHMYQDGLKVFSFQFTDEKEDPLLSNTFAKIEIGKNMRGLLTDLNIYSSFFDSQAMVEWTGGCDTDFGDIFQWDKEKIEMAQNSPINVTIVKVDRSAVCPDAKTQESDQTLTNSATMDEKKRFSPRSREYETFVGSVLEFMSDPYVKSYSESLDYCMRLNGYLLTIPQNEEELEVMDKAMWDFMMKRVSNNVTFLIKNKKFVGMWMAAETKLSEAEKSSEVEKFLSRDITYPNNGQFQWYHTLTGKALNPYLPGNMMIYMHQADAIVRKQCGACRSSMKDPNPDHTFLFKTIAWCQYNSCTQKRNDGAMCSFPTEPTFKVRGLCSDAPMDTQYKLADHQPMDLSLSQKYWEWGPDTRGYVGPKGWTITRNHTDKSWRMTHYYYTDLSLTMQDSDRLPVGRHKWRVENNICNEGETSSETLLISACEEGDFTCDDGKCLDISQRCNNIEVRYNKYFRYDDYLWLGM